MMLACLRPFSHPLQLTDVFPANSRFCNPSHTKACRFPSYRNHRNSRRKAFTARNCSSSRGEASGNPNADRLSPYQVLGIDPSSPCCLEDIKTAFRAKVKKFHPDVNKDGRDSDVMIRRVIQAYEILSKQHQFEIAEREYADPFDYPECEALDVFVNEAFCVGQDTLKECYILSLTDSGVQTPLLLKQAIALSFRALTEKPSISGHGEDYQVQVAVGQCPRSCIHYVTPLQRVILEELLDSVLKSPCSSAEAATLDSLVVKARFENNRYQKPKKNPKASAEYVDWL
ncbi:hypothetical protein ACLOJK_026027 [Asimina triloba]